MALLPLCFDVDGVKTLPNQQLHASVVFAPTCLPHEPHDAEGLDARQLHQWTTDAVSQRFLALLVHELRVIRRQAGSQYDREGFNTTAAGWVSRKHTKLRPYFRAYIFSDLVLDCCAWDLSSMTVQT